MFGFRSLIEPLSTDDFLDVYYEKRACHISGDAGKFGHLCGWDDVNSMINDRLSTHSRVKLVKNKKPLPSEALGKIDYWLRQGATLVVDAVNSLDPVLRRFTEVLGRDLNIPTWINIYVSWPQKQGFDIHFDTHDVFVVQTEGRKRWVVYNPTKVLPLDQQRGQPKGDPPPESEKYLECVLSPGDVLYIPRGHWHYAVSETPSVHLTVGLSSRSATDFLQWLAVKLRDSDPFWRQNFPVIEAARFGGERPPEVLEEHLEEFRSRLRSAVEDDTLVEGLLEYCMTASPLSRDYQLPTEAMIRDSLTPEMVFEHHPAQKFLVSYDAGTRRVVALARGHILDLQNIPRAVAERVFQTNEPFSGRDLENCRASFTWEKARPFLERLYQEGLIRLVSDPPDL